MANRVSDETFIERFISSDKVEKVQDFSGDKTQLLEALASIRIEGGLSAVLDAIHVGAAHTAERNAASQEHRKALVLITDGEDRNSFYKLDDVVKFLREVNVQVFVIGIVAQLDQNSSFIRLSPREKAENLLKRIAEESGGRIFLPRNNTELLRATNEIIHDLHGQFILNYQSTNDHKKKGFRKVDVKVIKADGEKLKVITPLGYFVDTPSAASKPK